MSLSNFRFSPHPVQWHEGMLLTPQHMQQYDILNKAALTYQLLAANPYHYGIINLTIDPPALVGGIFRVMSIEAIMPDGSIIFYPYNKQQNLAISQLEIPLQQYKQELSNAGLKIYLALPENANLVDNSKDYYQSVEYENIVDQNTGDNPISMPRLVPKLDLIIADKKPARRVSMPIAEITFNGQSYQQTAYVAPLFTIDIASHVGAICMELCKKTREKIVYLQSQIAHNIYVHLGTGHNFSEIEDVRRRLLKGLIPFENTLRSKPSPFWLFILLSSLAGDAASIRHSQMLPEFSHYDHDDIYATYKAIVDFIDDVLSSIKQSYQTVTFKNEGRVFSVKTEATNNEENFIVGVLAKPNTTQDDLIAWVNNCVITSDSFVREVQDTRVRGAERVITDKIEQLNLSSLHGMLLLTIPKNNRYIKAGELLHMFNISDNAENRPVQIVMYRVTNEEK